MRLAARMDRIGTETAFEAAASARALEATGRHVIHLELGEPDFDTPRNVSEAAARALLDEADTHYTPAIGIEPLREAIVAEVARWKGIATTPDQVVVTPGAKPIMFYAMLALMEEGDEVIYPNPGFPIYESMARYVGGDPVPAPLREENDFRMDVDEVAGLDHAAHEADRLQLAPQPDRLDPDRCRHPARGRAGARARPRGPGRRDLRPPPVLGRAALDRDAAGHGGAHDHARRLLKTFAMTGWRLGYGVMPEWLVPAFSRLVINSVRARTPSPRPGLSRR